MTWASCRVGSESLVLAALLRPAPDAHAQMALAAGDRVRFLVGLAPVHAWEDHAARRVSIRDRGRCHRATPLPMPGSFVTARSGFSRLARRGSEAATSSALPWDPGNSQSTVP